MMKRVFSKSILVIAVIICCISFLANKKEASADAMTTIQLQQVEDIDNYPYPSTTLVSIAEGGSRYYNQFTINSPGEVKALFRCGVNARGNGNAWISRDELGFDRVGSISSFSGSESNLSWFLEKGTYYINYSWSEWFSQIRVALLYEDSGTQEDYNISDFQHSTPVELEKTTKGFLSTEAPNDYYSFQLTKKANVTIEYSFDVLKNTGNNFGYCTLYDGNTNSLMYGTYDKSNRGAQKLVYLLDPGTYYVKLSDLYGNTTLSIKPMYYDIKLTPARTEGWTKKPVKVNIDTTIDYSEILVVKKDVKESVINNRDVWTNDITLSVKVDGETFEVTKSGVYSVRITDKYGNNTVKKIKISTIDVTKPKVTGVTDKKSYKKPVTVKWTDTQSGIDTDKTTLNGKKVTNGIKITQQGKYTLKVYDKIGNYRTVVFYVDTTAPTAGIENGKTYHDSVTLKLKDNLSGIKKIVVDDVEELAASTSLSFYFDGTYVVKLWDNAGNYRKVVFTIKK